MKKNGFLFSCLLASNALMAQDIVLLKTGDEIKTRVIEVTDNLVKYKRYDNLSGPTYSYEKTEVFSIKYENGEKKVMTTSGTSATGTSANSSSTTRTSTTGAKEVLTNEAVVNMHNKGLPASIVISKIKSSKNNFDISTDALIKLKEDKISDDIMNAMVDAAGDDSKHLIVTDINDPMSPHESGIYYFKQAGGRTEMIALEPSVYSQSNSGGYLAQSLTYGLAKVTQDVTLDGNMSRMQLEETQPVFYFYFDINKNSLSQSSMWWFAAATSPNEFLLVDFKQSNKSRKVEIGSSNIVGSSSGVDDRHKTKFQFEKIAPGIYKVYFEQPINGEFCFMYAGGVPQGSAAINKVYDFGVR